MIKRSLSLLLLCVAAFSAGAQQFDWAVDFNTVFDNREGDNRYTDTKTFFQTQLSPEIGVSFLDGTHALAGGVVWTQPIGCEWDGYRLSPTLYYRYKKDGWRFAMGMFPRTMMVRRMPNYVWSDSVYYAQRNVRGLMVSHQGESGFFEAVLDWRGMQSETRREAFNILVQGEWHRPQSVFLAGGVAMMNHFALTANAGPDQHIVDNFMVNPYVGIDLSGRCALDSCAVRAGALMGITRNRAYGGWRAPAGAWLDVCVQWHWFGWKNTFYCGGRLFPYYTEFGSLLDQGEPYYQSKWYDRTSIYGYILNNDFMNLQASLDFNFAADNFTFYQRLTLRVYVDSSFKKRPASYKLPAVY